MRCLCVCIAEVDKLSSRLTFEEDDPKQAGATAKGSKGKGGDDKSDKRKSAMKMGMNRFKEAFK